MSSDGKVLIVSSRNNYFHLWSIEANRFVRKIELPTTVQNSQIQVKDCILLPGYCYDSKLLAVLSHNGCLSIYNIETSTLVASLHTHNNANTQTNNPNQLLNEQKLMQICCSSNSRFMCSLTQDGIIQVYDLDCCLAIKNMKATSNLMTKSNTINSTTNKTTIVGNEADKPLSRSFKQQKQQNVSKRVQNLLNNDQIHSKLIRILKCYNEYPARYRMFIWKMLLKLPENYEAYASFVEKGLHPVYKDLSRKYPLKSQKCIRLLERLFKKIL